MMIFIRSTLLISSAILLLLAVFAAYMFLVSAASCHRVSTMIMIFSSSCSISTGCFCWCWCCRIWSWTCHAGHIEDDIASMLIILRRTRRRHNHSRFAIITTIWWHYQSPASFKTHSLLVAAQLPTHSLTTHLSISSFLNIETELYFRIFTLYMDITLNIVYWWC